MSSEPRAIPQDDTTPASSRLPWAGRDWVALLVLAAIVFCLYFQTRHFDFIEYDDKVYIFENPHMINGISWESVRSAFTTVVDSNWHPLTSLAWLVLETCSGRSAGPFHLVNSISHTVNVVLLFAFFRSATGRYWPAVFTAALWGLHPLRVESVAWVAELKDVLCGLFWLACMLAYLSYSRRRTVGRYLLILLLYVLALLAKPMAMTLCAVLLLLDHWPLERPSDGSAPSAFRWWRWRVLEKLPLVLLSIGSMVGTIASQSSQGSVATLNRFSLISRIENAIVSTVIYLRDMVFPARLGVFYSHPAMFHAAIPIVQVTAALLLLVVVTAAVCLWAKSKPYLPVGWFWFLGTLVPVIGLLQVGEQSRADRYTYLPSIGITVAVVWLLADLTRNRRAAGWTAAAAAVAACTALAVVANTDIGYWHDTITLFTHADEVIPDNYLAKGILAIQYHGLGEKDREMKLATDADALAPDSITPVFSYALALLDAGRLDGAEREFRKLTFEPTAWYGIGLVNATRARQCLDRNDKIGEIAYRKKACNDLIEALKINRYYSAAEDALADQTARIGDLPRAIKTWRDLLQKAPRYGPAYGHLADALRVTGDIHGAVGGYRSAIALGETDPLWEANLAYLVATAPGSTTADVQQMVPLATDARNQTRGKDPAALDALAACLARVGRFDDAITTAQAAVDQANLANNPRLAKDIQKRLTRYQNALPYVAGE